jgi:hypothetical protein
MRRRRRLEVDEEEWMFLERVERAVRFVSEGGVNFLFFSNTVKPVDVSNVDSGGETS